MLLPMFEDFLWALSVGDQEDDDGIEDAVRIFFAATLNIKCQLVL